jgi:hypothetical protein
LGPLERANLNHWTSGLNPVIEVEFLFVIIMIKAGVKQGKQFSFLVLKRNLKSLRLIPNKAEDDPLDTNNPQTGHSSRQ